MRNRWCQRFPTGEYVETRGVVATSIALAALAAGATAGGAVASGALQSSAAKSAAKTQSDAANKSAELQAQSSRDALAFQKAQAAEDARRFESTQHSNYDQWAARQGYQSTIGSMLGLPARNIPSYQTSMLGGSPQGMPTAADPKAAAFIADWQQTHPVSEGIAPLADALQKAGLSTGRYMYGNTPSDNEVVVGGQKYKVLGGEKTPGAYWYTPGSDDSATGATNAGGGYVAPLSSLIAQPATSTRRPLTAALQMPYFNTYGAA